MQYKRQSTLVALFSPFTFVFSIFLFSACSQEESIYDTKLTKEKECSFSSSGAENCNLVFIGEVTHTITTIRQESSNHFNITLGLEDNLWGIRFPNNGTVIQTEGCSGEGRECLFARWRSEQLDSQQCRRYSQTILVMRLTENDHWSGVFKKISGQDGLCTIQYSEEKWHLELEPLS